MSRDRPFTAAAAHYPLSELPFIIPLRTPLSLGTRRADRFPRELNRAIAEGPGVQPVEDEPVGAVATHSTILGRRPVGRVLIVVAEADDDAASLSSKLATLGGENVALVLPDDVATFDGPLAMHLLGRLANRESIALAVVSRRPRTRYWAQSEGLATFACLSAVPRRISPINNGRHPFVELAGHVLRYIEEWLTWLAAFGLVLFLVAIAYLIVPHAVVVVRPVVDDLRANVRIQASVDATEPDATRALVPGRQVYLQVWASSSLPLDRPDHPLDGRAVGWETFENRTSNSVTIPVGSVVRTLSGVSFATTEATTLASRPGAVATVPIRARNSGSESNVKRGEIIQIEGNLRWLVVAVNEDPVAGGGRPGEKVVTAWDARKLTDQVATLARREAQRQLAAQAGKGESPVDESIQVVPIEQSFDQPVGDKADRLQLNAQFRASAMIVDQDQLRRLAIQMWRPDVRPGFELQPTSVEASAPLVLDVNQTTVTFNVPVEGIAFHAINQAQVARYVRLRPPADAGRDLARLIDLASPPSITVTPTWIGRAYRVEVDVDTTLAKVSAR